MAPLLELRAITKRYPGVLANDDVGLTVDAGEVVAVLGENGAGKSTVMNIIAGLVRPDAGDILIGGRTVRPRSPRDAAGMGIGMVHQHFKLVPTMTVAENIVLGDYRAGRWLLRPGRNAARIAALLAELGLNADPATPVGDLDLGARQKVEIAKALFRDAGILILDEPTAILSRRECDQLYDIIRHLAGRGVAVLLISHKLDDIFAVCDRVYVMRQGRVVGERRVAGTSRDDLVRLVVGGALELPERDGAPSPPGPALIRLRDVTLRRPGAPPALRDVTFDLHEGEVLAVAGVEGNGQAELVEALAGMLPPAAGRIDHDFAGQARHPTAAALRRAGLGHVPGDRHGMAMLGDLDLRDNVMLTHFHMPGFARFGLLRRGIAAALADKVIDRFEVRTPHAGTAIGRLSGGNQQKLVVGREMNHATRVLLAAHPTRGLDLRTIAFMQRQLLDHRNRGGAVLLVSSDLAEIWRVADRVMVASSGRLHGPVRIADTTIEEVGAWMTA